MSPRDRQQTIERERKSYLVMIIAFVILLWIISCVSGCHSVPSTTSASNVSHETWESIAIVTGIILGGGIWVFLIRNIFPYEKYFLDRKKG